MAYVSLFAFLGACAYTDIKSNIIPNRYVIAGIVVALLISCLRKGCMAGLGGPIVRMLVISAIFWPAYAIKKIGAGDIKLLMVMSAFTSIKYALFAFGAAVYICLVPILCRKVRGIGLRNYRLPMAPSIYLGTAICYVGGAIL